MMMLSVRLSRIAQPTKSSRTATASTIVHTGSRDLFSWLIRNGFVHVLFAGNALATHDIEQSF